MTLQDTHQSMSNGPEIKGLAYGNVSNHTTREQTFACKTASSLTGHREKSCLDNHVVEVL